jgi:hypothetical protein
LIFHVVGLHLPPRREAPLQDVPVVQRRPSSGARGLVRFFLADGVPEHVVLHAGKGDGFVVGLVRFQPI